MSANPSYEQSKQVAEASRETSGSSRASARSSSSATCDRLIHPQPAADPAMAERGDAFLERLRAFLSERVDPLQIERDARIRTTSSTASSSSARWA
jgi:hypothetical protein